MIRRARKVTERSRLHIPIAVYIHRYDIATLYGMLRDHVLPFRTICSRIFFATRRTSELRNAFKQIERKVSFPHRWPSSLGARQISAAGKRPGRL